MGHSNTEGFEITEIREKEMDNLNPIMEENAAYMMEYGPTSEHREAPSDGRDNQEFNDTNNLNKIEEH